MLGQRSSWFWTRFSTNHVLPGASPYSGHLEPPARRPPGHQFGLFGTSDGSLPNRDRPPQNLVKVSQTALVFRAVALTLERCGLQDECRDRASRLTPTGFE